MRFGTSNALLGLSALVAVASAQEYGSGYQASADSTTTSAASSLINTGTVTTSSFSSSGTATGASTTHTVAVGNGGKLVFDPSSLTAAVGDKVIFNFYPMNHSVVQSRFESPCVPLSGGINSGFLPVSSNDKSSSFTYTVKDTAPFWYYCSQGKHCQLGMVGVINPSNNTSRQVSQYAAAASSATSNIPGATVVGGAVSTNGAAAPSTASPAVTSATSSAASSSATAASASSTSRSNAAQPTGAGSREMYAGAALAGAALLVVGL